MTKNKEAKKYKSKKKEKLNICEKKHKKKKPVTLLITVERDFIFNNAISHIEKLIPEAKDAEQSTRLSSIRLDLLDAWNIERTASRI